MIIREAKIDDIKQIQIIRTVLKKHSADKTYRYWGTLIGIYTGGMKKHIKEYAQTKPVILATYSSASVGLDIPGLDTMIFATPQTNVTQASGRILRTQKHLREVQPLIYDIVDRIII